MTWFALATICEANKPQVGASFRSFGMLLLPICMQLQTLAPLWIGSKAKWSSALMRTVVLLSCTIETRWSPPLATQNGSPNRRVRFSPRAVLLAQTKVGFLSGGRNRRMKELPEKEVLAQLEEALPGRQWHLHEPRSCVSSWVPSTCEGCLVPLR